MITDKLLEFLASPIQGLTAPVAAAEQYYANPGKDFWMLIGVVLNQRSCKPHLQANAANPVQRSGDLSVGESMIDKLLLQVFKEPLISEPSLLRMVEMSLALAL